MSEVLVQKKFGIARKEFRLTETGIAIHEKKNRHEWEYSVPYDRIGFETIIKKDNSTRYMPYAMGIVFIASLAWMLMLIIHPPMGKDQVNYMTAGIGILLFGMLTNKGWLQRNLSYEYLTGGEKTIEFFRNEPNERAYDQFKLALYEKMRGLHKKRLFHAADMNLPFEMHAERIEWLKHINAINEEEIHDFKRRLYQHQQKNWN